MSWGAGILGHPIVCLGVLDSYWGDPLSEGPLVETVFFLPLDSWRSAADGDWRGTLVQPPAQPVIKHTFPPGHCLPVLLYSALPESLLPRPLGEPAPVAATAASLAARD